MKKGYLLLAGMALSTLMLACNKQQYGLPDQSREFGQTVTYNNKVDVLLMIDNSSSMGLYQDRLAAQAHSIVDALNKLKMDYTIAVVTSDMRSGGNGGRFIGEPKVLKKNTSNLVNHIRSRIQIGTSGSDLERGLESIVRVLDPNYLGGDGNGFFREDALLAIVALSNEDDYSSNSVSYYKDYFDALKPPFKGGAKAWVLNFIGVPNLESSCSTALDGIYKEPGLRWIELADYSGGRVEAVCDTSLATAVNNVRKKIVEIMTDFHLGRIPVVSSIKVWINGKEIPQSTTNGWEYIPGDEILRFHGDAVPGADDRVVVDFTPASAS